METYSHISLCAGIDGFGRGFHASGIRTVAAVEKDENCRMVLRCHYPDAIILDDLLTAGAHNLPQEPFVVSGGTPCQSFSVAGKRGSLSDARGNLMFEFVRICDELNPRFICWENVPGVLSTDDNAFGCLLAALVGADTPLVPPRQCGGRWTNAGLVVGPKRRAAWRILDAQHFGVAQRRRRVFVVASATESGVCPSTLLFERTSRGGNTQARRETRQELATDVAASLRGSGGGARGFQLDAEMGLVAAALNSGGNTGGFRTEPGEHLVAVTAEDTAVTAKWAKGSGGPAGDECQNMVVAPPTNSPYADNEAQETKLIPVSINGHGPTHALRSEGADASEDGTGRGTPIVAFSCKDSGNDAGALSPTLRSMNFDGSHMNGGGQVAVALPLLEVGARTGISTDDVRCSDGIGQDGDPMYTLQSGKQHGVAVAFTERGRAGGRCLDHQEELAYSLNNPGNGGRTQERQVAGAFGVRRLTPTECERLQGFPDGHTVTGVDESGKLVAMSDSVRYRMLGNAVCCAVSRWLGERITNCAPCAVAR